MERTYENTMKRIVYIIAGAAVVAAVFWFLSASHATAQVTTTNIADAQYQRAVDQQTERSKRYAELLAGQEAMHQHAEVLVAKQEQLMARQEADSARFEKILDTWEKQQKQYQRYLDSLAK